MKCHQLRSGGGALPLTLYFLQHMDADGYISNTPHSAPTADNAFTIFITELYVDFVYNDYAAVIIIRSLMCSNTVRNKNKKAANEIRAARPCSSLMKIFIHHIR